MVPTITAEHNESLIQVVLEDEIENTLHDMHPNKISIYDDFFDFFYQYFWHIVNGKVVVIAIKYIFQFRSMPS